MISAPVELSKEDRDAIRTAQSKGLDAQELWSDPSLDAIKSKIKQHYIEVQKFRCCYCQKLHETRHGRLWDIDHIIASSIYPQFMFEPENLSASCVECNSAKSDQNVLDRARVRFPSKSEHYIIIHPHFDEWGKHLKFTGNLFSPKSSKGVETIRLCKLYRYYENFGESADRIEDDRFEEEVDKLSRAKSTEEAAPSLAAISAIIGQRSK